MNTWHIHIEGQVQGVGFRPTVYRIANTFGIKGWVSNTSDGLHIEFNGGDAIARAFYSVLLQQVPKLARINKHRLYITEPTTYETFEIVPSKQVPNASLLITPDVAICEDCRTELSQAKNRRYSYPFITCTNCGPRYSVIRELPYDREMTTMAQFEMCSTCNAEYQKPEDRRYYAQTNSCPSCSIALSMDGQQDQSAIIQQVVEAWQEGKIVAIKGIGGYLLTCDANNPATIKTLRERKQRPSKPFAVMFPGIAEIKQYFNLRTDEETHLKGIVSPIVLLDLPKSNPLPLAIDDIAPQLDQLGVMSPYAPIYEILLKAFGGPIIATSGNVSNTPIIFEDEKAETQLSQIADLILKNNRDIVIPQDDSVIKIAKGSNQSIIIRRSRGLAPTFIQPEISWPNETWLATGADLKSSFGILHKNNTYLSQYLGNQSDLESQNQYQHTLDHFQKLLNSNPSVVLCDQHPSYFSTQIAAAISKDNESKLYKVQHHLAHFSAILGEHTLIHHPNPVLGFIWDGTGFGLDEQIWGGECFLYHGYQFERVGQLEYFDHFLGDKMSKEPRIAAFSLAHSNPEPELLIRPHFSALEWNLYHKMLRNGSKLKTSSMGRLFDAVAAILGFSTVQSYEGEAAMQVEKYARAYFDHHDTTELSPYSSFLTDYKKFSGKNLIWEMAKDLMHGTSKDHIAARFLYTLAYAVRETALHHQVHELAFSGGVFQNALLVDLLHSILPKPFQLYFHEQLSPNDENISFGQMVYYHIEQQHHLLSSKSSNYVFSNSRQNYQD